MIIKQTLSEARRERPSLVLCIYIIKVWPGPNLTMIRYVISTQFLLSSCCWLTWWGLVWCVWPARLQLAGLPTGCRAGTKQAEQLLASGVSSASPHSAQTGLASSTCLQHIIVTKRQPNPTPSGQHRTETPGRPRGCQKLISRIVEAEMRFWWNKWVQLC